jgi:hypothetical protein
MASLDGVDVLGVAPPGQAVVGICEAPEVLDEARIAQHLKAFGMSGDEPSFQATVEHDRRDGCLLP